MDLANTYQVPYLVYILNLRFMESINFYIYLLSYEQ